MTTLYKKIGRRYHPCAEHEEWDSYHAGAHLDHTPENCDTANLRAWCQRCHLRYDAEHHANTARETRRARKALGDLFADGAAPAKARAAIARATGEQP